MTDFKVVYTLPVQFRPEARTYVPFRKQDDSIMLTMIETNGNVLIDETVPESMSPKTFACVVVGGVIGMSKELYEYMWEQ